MKKILLVLFFALVVFTPVCEAKSIYYLYDEDKHIIGSVYYSPLDDSYDAFIGIERQDKKKRNEKYKYLFKEWKSPNGECLIKGNISPKTGEQLYYLPGWEGYDSIIIDPEFGEQWFCTEFDAYRAKWKPFLKEDRPASIL